MNTNHGGVTDALVDFYRAMQSIKSQRRQSMEDASSGAGVDPKKVCKPSKRIKGWHSGASTTSLKQYVAAIDVEEFAPVIKAWRANKKASR